LSTKRKDHTKSVEKQVKTRYSWKFWCMVTVTIAAMVVIILLAALSIKALVQDIQLVLYENKVEGTVSVAEFVGGTWEYNETDTGQHQKFDSVHYVITFDEKTAGYSQYEYRAKDIISSEKYVGDRYVVLFNSIEDPTLIQKEDIAADNAILLSFFVLAAIVVIFRKNFSAWLTKIDMKF